MGAVGIRDDPGGIVSAPIAGRLVTIGIVGGAAVGTGKGRGMTVCTVGAATEYVGTPGVCEIVTEPAVRTGATVVDGTAVVGDATILPVVAIGIDDTGRIPGAEAMSS